MATDAKFDKIQKIVPHENADALEIAIVSNFPCVVKKDTFKVGDVVFYIRDDAKLVEYDAWKDFMKRYEDPSALFPQDCYHAEKFIWQEGLLKYLGGGGRVKTIKLRGKTSMGILMKPEELGLGSGLTWEGAEKVNAKIADPETGSAFLEKEFGVAHWEMPLSSSMGPCNARGPLISGLWKTDEENFQNIDDELFPWNEEVLITRKLDGSSCSISSTPDGDIHVMSRSLDLKFDDDNVWNRASKCIIPFAKTLAKYYNETIVLRGEVTGAGINASKVNLDCHGDPVFNMFAVVFPTTLDENKRIGLYGTPWHFLEVNKVCKKLTGFEIKTVPIEGTAILTRKLLEDISNRPRNKGEGCVINTKSLLLPHFKSKSKDYLLYLG